MDDALDALVRRVDEDRWLASRFAPPEARARLIAIYALNHEIARIAETVTLEGIPPMRLLWWGEAVEEIFAGQKPRAQPALQALAATLQSAPLSAETLHALIVAHLSDFELTPFKSWLALETYIDATAGGVFRLALTAALGRQAPEGDAFVRAAARAWAYAGSLRSEYFWQRRGRSIFPEIEDCDDADILRADMLRRVRAAYAEARALARALPSAAFPAIGYVALTPVYLRALKRAPLGFGPRPPLLGRQWRLLVASATGRL